MGGDEPGMFGEKTVQAGDPDVIETIDRIAHELRRNRGLFGDGQIRGAGGRDDDGPAPGGHVAGAQRNGPRLGVEQGGWQSFGDGRVCFKRGAGHQEGVAGGGDAFGDGGDLLRGLALAKNDLGETLAEAPLVVHPGEPEVLDRLLAQILKKSDLCCLGRQGSGRHLIQQNSELVGVHGHRGRVSDGTITSSM